MFARIPANKEKAENTWLLDPVRLHAAPLITCQAEAQRLRLRAIRVPGSQFGSHLSRFKGRGMEFDEVRAYQPGDEARAIDWRVSARTGDLHTKLYREERERPVVLWVDQRAGMRFATQGVFKSVQAGRLAALIAWAAVQQGDRLGGLVMSDHQHYELRPRRGRRAVMGLIDALVRASGNDSMAAKQALQNHLDRLRRVLRPGSLVFLISDFADLARQQVTDLRRMAIHNEVIMVQVYDALEAKLPPPGRYPVSDGRRSLVIDAADRRWRQQHEERFQARQSLLQSACEGGRIRRIDCRTDQDAAQVLKQNFTA
jgi:uncharacterized protein (DUF58 family)